MRLIIWHITWLVFIRPFPRNIFRKWNIFLLNLFGAKINYKANIYSSAKIYAPWNLEMEEYSCLAPEVDCYNVDKVTLGAFSTVSQKSYLCTASHDITKSDNQLVTAPIEIKSQSWIAADAFIGMGVTVGEGAVVGARACVYKDVSPWTVVGGNPAKFLKKRTINE